MPVAFHMRLAPAKGGTRGGARGTHNVREVNNAAARIILYLLVAGERQHILATVHELATLHQQSRVTFLWKAMRHQQVEAAVPAAFNHHQGSTSTAVTKLLTSCPVEALPADCRRLLPAAVHYCCHGWLSLCLSNECC